MTTVGEIYQKLCEIAPPALAEPWDNCGLLLGRADAEATDVLVALDATSAVIRSAIQWKCQLIITHHPLYFTLPRQLNDTDPTAEKLLSLSENGIALICMHTCLDAAEGGVNDRLAELLELRGVRPLLGEGELSGIGRVGECEVPLSAAALCGRLRGALRLEAVKLHDAGRPIRRVAVLGGSGGDALALAQSAGADALVTGDVKHHVFLQAQEMGMTLIDAGHFHTEDPICDVLAQRLTQCFPEVKIRRSDALEQVIRFY